MAFDAEKIEGRLDRAVVAGTEVSMTLETVVLTDAVTTLRGSGVCADATAARQRSPASMSPIIIAKPILCLISLSS